MNKITGVVLLIYLSFAFVGCEKVEGPGGSSSITGQIMIETHKLQYVYAGFPINQDTLFKHEVFVSPALEEKVYIIYGEDNTYHDDDTRTFVDGVFRFDNLEPGDYSIYVYEDCPFDIESGNFYDPECDEVPIIIPVNIPKNGDEINIGEIIITKYEKV